MLTPTIPNNTDVAEDKSVLINIVPQITIKHEESIVFTVDFLTNEKYSSSTGMLQIQGASLNL